MIQNKSFNKLKFQYQRISNDDAHEAYLGEEESKERSETLAETLPGGLLPQGRAHLELIPPLGIHFLVHLYIYLFKIY